MKKEIILSGFGGQGVMSIGKNLVEAGVEEELEVSWVPSYGPEMRGGTANCSVILSDERIGSPVVEAPTEVIAMNRPSLTKFEPSVVPGDGIAADLGNPKVGNMVMLGAYIGATKALKVETVENMIQEMFTGKKAKLVPLNLEALHRGIACAE